MKSWQVREPETETEIKREIKYRRALIRQVVQDMKKLDEEIKRHKARIREMDVKLRRMEE